MIPFVTNLLTLRASRRNSTSLYFFIFFKNIPFAISTQETSLAHIYGWTPPVREQTMKAIKRHSPDGMYVRRSVGSSALSENTASARTASHSSFQLYFVVETVLCRSVF